MNKKGGIIADVVLILISFAVGTFFGRYILDWLIKLVNKQFPLI